MQLSALVTFYFVKNSKNDFFTGNLRELVEYSRVYQGVTSVRARCTLRDEQLEQFGRLELINKDSSRISA